MENITMMIYLLCYWLGLTSNHGVVISEKGVQSQDCTIVGRIVMNIQKECLFRRHSFFVVQNMPQ